MTDQVYPISGIAGKRPTALFAGGICRKIRMDVMVLQQDVDDSCFDVIVAVCR
jgi:hypothetical protein